MRSLMLVLFALTAGIGTAHAGKADSGSAATALWRTAQKRYVVPVKPEIDHVTHKQLRRIDRMQHVTLALHDVEGRDNIRGVHRTVAYQPGDRLSAGPTSTTTQAGVTVSRRVDEAGRTVVDTSFKAGTRIPKLMRGLKDAWKVRPGYEVQYKEVVGTGKVEVVVYAPQDVTRPLLRGIVERK